MLLSIYTSRVILMLATELFCKYISLKHKPGGHGFWHRKAMEWLFFCLVHSTPQIDLSYRQWKIDF